jgi:hypothetical protein
MTGDPSARGTGEVIDTQIERERPSFNKKKSLKKKKAGDDDINAQSDSDKES